MKKAILLLGMTIFVAGVLFFRDADADTVLIKQPIYWERLVKNAEEQFTEERTKEELLIEESQKEDLELETETLQDENKLDDTPADVIIPAESDKVSSVAFSQLTIEEQKIYSEILSSLLALEKETTLSVKDASLINKAFQCVMLDHPEIFYIDGYKYTEYSSDEVVQKIVFSGNYIYNDEEIQSRKAKLEEHVCEILKMAPNTEDEYEKVKYVFEYIILHTEYDTASVDNQNICSVFLNGRSVCQGYAKAVQYLLREMGIASSLVIGTVRQGDGHAWNMVSVNDNWYYLDATWGDAFYLFGNEEQKEMINNESSVNYDYLCVTTEQIQQTHTIDMPVVLPQCTSLVDNYYVREGVYFESYDEARIRNIFLEAQNAGQEMITLKCSNPTVYDAVCMELLDNQKIFEFMQTEEGAVAYTDNKEQYSITFWF